MYTTNHSTELSNRPWTGTFGELTVGQDSLFDRPRKPKPRNAAPHRCLEFIIESFRRIVNPHLPGNYCLAHQLSWVPSFEASKLQRLLWPSWRFRNSGVIAKSAPKHSISLTPSRISAKNLSKLDLQLHYFYLDLLNIPNI